MTTEFPETARPRLLKGVRSRFDQARDTWLLLAPERTLELDAVAAAILAEVDGERSFSEIVDILAAKYNAPKERISADVRTFLSSLVERRMLEVDVP
ncbi:pyrroloquinoline quinone biosynthesis peptide chaperone PqqD [Chelativorans salis]|uniref:Pyrroloquinoline quinone biosynthesis peptide chaperone PqqD n=1 Tax=Chelativorans salis TaxID=2978478 RepID=A0ABT2LID1_9HYPH|nr:pyrroloquinoline quinone biosynthesis peptide chaperone PqqD [Chelativorans sp. EGI FJ00035]MCT7374265.1 pyrroloquinoline quinone biosynthesis peptide chaperone PqqD [Chelativorans sp. EGI FJ00035]